MTSLNPVFTVGNQIMEPLRRAHGHDQGRRPQTRAVELLELVGIPDAQQAADKPIRTSFPAACASG